MKYFYENHIAHLPICVDLVNNFEQIKKEVVEFCSQPTSLTDYPNYPIPGYDRIYENYWKAAPLSLFKDEHAELTGTPELTKLLKALTSHTREHCPTIAKIISPMEEQGTLANSFISRLLPGTVINPHVGWSPNWMRVHMGIVCDLECKMFIEDECRTWEEGKLLAFIDGPPYPHSVRHNGTDERIVVSVDLNLKYLKSLGVAVGTGESLINF